MNLVMLSRDNAIMKENSPSSERMVKYGKFFDHIDIVVFARGMVEGKKQLSSNVTATAAGSSFGPWRFLQFLWEAKKIVALQKSPAVITAQDPFEIGLVGLLLSRLYHLPLQLQVHTDFVSAPFRAESLVNKIRYRLGAWLLPQADSVRVVSARIATSLGEIGVEGRRVHVLPIVVDARDIKGESNSEFLHTKYPQFDFIFLMASRLTKEKNIDMALAAMKELVSLFPKTGLVIVGKGPEYEHLSNLVKQYTVQANVILEDWAEGLRPYYESADAFVLTSWYEGYGRTVVEAAVLGCPVIMTDVGCARDYPSAPWKVIPVGDTEKLVEAMKVLMAEKGTSQEKKAPVSFLTPEEDYFHQFRNSLDM